MNNNSRRIRTGISWIALFAIMIVGFIVCRGPQGHVVNLPFNYRDESTSITASYRWVRDIGKQTAVFQSADFSLSSTELIKILGNIRTEVPLGQQRAYYVGSNTGCSIVVVHGSTKYLIGLVGGPEDPEFISTGTIENTVSGEQ